MITFEQCRKIFPQYYDNILEIDELCKAYIVLVNLFLERIEIIRNNLLMTENITKTYLEELEKFWGIIPDDTKTTEYRLAQIKLRFSDRIPYDIIRLKTMIKSILDDKPFELTENYSGQQVIITIDGRYTTINEKLLKTTNNMCRLITPAHIEILIKLLYTTWSDIKSYYKTWDVVLQGNTWKVIKETVVS